MFASVENLINCFKVNWFRKQSDRGRSFFDIIFDSFGSFYTFNDFDLKSKTNKHEPTGVKQILYSLVVFIILLV